ncbi:hypothetical protein ACOME3_006800 [Neoechinorhynchus agilis]
MSKGTKRSIQNLILVSFFYLGATTPFALLQLITPFIIKNKSSCHLQAAWFFVNKMALHLTFAAYCLKFYILLFQVKKIRVNMKYILRGTKGSFMDSEGNTTTNK